MTETDKNAFQNGYDNGFDDGFEAGKALMRVEIESLETIIKELESYIQHLSEKEWDA